MFGIGIYARLMSGVIELGRGRGTIPGDSFLKPKRDVQL